MNESIRKIEQKDFSSHPLLARLLELHDIPKQLYIQGNLPEIHIDEYGRSTPRILTVVGSRKNTSYGRQALEMLLASLQGENVIIISGLAYGIDALAHKGALTNNLTTIAIPGSGLHPSAIYPSTHRHLAEDIVSSGGALISELDPDTHAAPWTFPQRNRIMAALADAVLLVEAEEKSGTLITARLAIDLGRDVGAIPGEIFSPTATGTNRLIHEGAYLVSTLSHLFSLLHLSEKENEGKNTTPLNWNGNEKIIMDILHEPTDKDILLEKTKLPLPDFITAFSSLEINGHIQESFGEVRRLV